MISARSRVLGKEVRIILTVQSLYCPRNGKRERRS
jgi:hypothetical protein